MYCRKAALVFFRCGAMSTAGWRTVKRYSRSRPSLVVALLPICLKMDANSLLISAGVGDEADVVGACFVGDMEPTEGTVTGACCKGTSEEIL